MRRRRTSRITSCSRPSLATLGTVRQQRILVLPRRANVVSGNFHALILFKDDKELHVVSNAVHRLVQRAIRMDGTCASPALTHCRARPDSLSRYRRARRRRRQERVPRRGTRRRHCRAHEDDQKGDRPAQHHEPEQSTHDLLFYTLFGLTVVPCSSTLTLPRVALIAIRRVYSYSH